MRDMLTPAAIVTRPGRCSPWRRWRGGAGAVSLNGIARDITGTWWPKMFEVRFVEAG